MPSNVYKIILLSLLSTVLVVFTNCGKQSKLNFTGGNIADVPVSASEVEAFSQTIHPITLANCAGCHTTTSPTHAAADPTDAFSALQSTGKINWVNPESSRLVVKLRSENHNCWGNCEDNAQEMLTAILEMKAMTGLGKSSTSSSSNFIATSLSRSVQTELDDVSNPQKSNSVRLNIESAMVRSPMVKATDASRGMILTVPQTKQTTLSETDASAGVAYLNFNVRVAGAYRVWMYTNAPSTNDNGFFVKFNNEAASTFDPTVNGTDYGWMLVPNYTRNLAVGTHTLEVREKKDGTKVNSIIVTADGAFNGTDVGSFVGVTLSYDLSSILKSPGIKLQVDIADFDPYSYKLLNPRIISPTANVKVKNMRILINKYFNPQNSAYTTVDKTVTPTDAEVSPFSTVISKDKGILLDKISFEFEKLEIARAGSTTGGGGGGSVDPAASLASYQANIWNVSRQYCMSCHTTTFPQHASANVQVAHDLALNEPLVDFDSPINSRLYQKVKTNRHNCGTNANCDTIAARFLQGINAWGAARGN